MDSIDRKLIEVQADQAKLASYYKIAFSSPEGQIVLRDLRDRCFAKKPTFSTNSNAMAFNEGMRAVYLNIETFVEYQPQTEGEN